MTKVDDKHKIQHLSFKRKEISKRKFGAGKPFKLDVKDRFLMLLVYYSRLYITYTLVGLVFDLDQSTACRVIPKIDSLIIKCVPISQKDI
jgi:hypothetical protein